MANGTGVDWRKKSNENLGCIDGYAAICGLSWVYCVSAVLLEDLQEEKERASLFLFRAKERPEIREMGRACK